MSNATIKVRASSLKASSYSKVLCTLRDSFPGSICSSLKIKERTARKIKGELCIVNQIEDNNGEFLDERLWYNIIISRNKNTGYRFVR